MNEELIEAYVENADMWEKETESQGKEAKMKSMLIVIDANEEWYEDRDGELHKRFGPAAVQACVNRYIDKGEPVKLAFRKMEDYLELEGIGDVMESEIEEDVIIEDKVIMGILYAKLNKDSE